MRLRLTILLLLALVPARAAIIDGATTSWPNADITRARLGIVGSNSLAGILSASTNYTDSRAVALSNLSYAIGADGTNFTLAASNAVYQWADAVFLYFTNWTGAISNLAQTKQHGTATLTNAAGNPNLATNLLGAGSVVVTSNNLGEWTITGSGGGGDPGGTNARQWGSVNLTNWSNIPTGAMANIPAVDWLTNATVALTNQGNANSVAASNLSYVIGANATNYANSRTNFVVATAGDFAITNQYTVGGIADIAPVLPYTLARFISSNTVPARMGLESYNAADVNGSFITGYRIRGTKLAPDVVVSNDVLLALSGNGWQGTMWTNSNALLAMKAETNYTAQNQPSYFQFLTTGRGTTTAVQRVRIEANGDVNVSNRVFVGAGLSGSNAVAPGKIIEIRGLAFTNHSAVMSLTNAYTNATIIAPNMLTNRGDSVVCEWVIHHRAASVATNVFQVVYGSEIIFNSGLASYSNGMSIVRQRITRATSGTQQDCEANVLPWIPAAGGIGATNAFTASQSNWIATPIGLRFSSSRPQSVTNVAFRMYYEAATQ